MARIKPAALAFIVLVPPAHWAQTQPDESWKNLGRIQHDRTYAFALRDGRCFSGSLISTDEESLAVEASQRGVPSKLTPNTPSRIAWKRGDVLLVSDNYPPGPRDAIYSGRSSWADVMASRPTAAEWLGIVTRDGRERKCRQPAVSDDAVRCDGSTVARSDIARVYYVRLKPATDWELFVSREGVEWLAPRTWFNYLLLGRNNVLLYDAAVPEDKTPAACQPAPGAAPPK